MRRYRSHKVVEAAPIHGISGVNAEVPFVDILTPGDAIVAGYRVEVPGNFFARGNPSPGDYLVRYEDGYLSWSPKQAFEDGYTVVTDLPDQDAAS
jgi:hypothetical protein